MSVKFHHLDNEGQPHFDVLKIPDAAGLTCQALASLAHNVQDEKSRAEASSVPVTVVSFDSLKQLSLNIQWLKVLTLALVFVQ